MDQQHYSSKSIRRQVYSVRNRSSIQLNIEMINNNINNNSKNNSKNNINNLNTYNNNNLKKTTNKDYNKDNVKQSNRKSNINVVPNDKKYIEETVKDLLKTINTQINAGVDLFDIKISEKQLLSFTDVIKYILKKEIRLKNDIIIVRYYLCLFPTFLERLNLQTKKIETQEILYKIGMYMKYKERKKNQVVFFNGQIGTLFYFILNGEVSVLIPSSYTCELTIQEYLDFFSVIMKFSDYEILRLTFESNKKILTDEFYNQIPDFEQYNQFLDQKSVTQSKEKDLDVFSYVERYVFEKKKIVQIEEERNNNNKIVEKKKMSNNYNKNKNVKDKNNEKKSMEDKKNLGKKNFILWKYVEVCKLHQGECFGEVALVKDNCKRTASIITTKNCIFGTISKEEYRNFFRDVMERSRKNTIEGLLKCKLFQGYNYFCFESKFFNCFIFSKHKKGDYIFKQGKNRDKFFYIKSGEVQIEINATFEQIDQIILSLGGNCKNKNIENIIRNNEKVQSFFKKIRKFQIYIISGGDFIGTDEMVNFLENSSIYNLSAVCLSTCDLLELNMNFFDSMYKEKRFKENYCDLVESRRQRLIKRLYELKMNTILHHFNLLKEDNNILNTYNNFDENDYKNHLLKNKSTIPNLSNTKIVNWRNKEDICKNSIVEEPKIYNNFNSNLLAKINTKQLSDSKKSRNDQNNILPFFKTQKNVCTAENTNLLLNKIKNNNDSKLNITKTNNIANNNRLKTVNNFNNGNQFKYRLDKIKNQKSTSNLYNRNINLYKTENLMTSVDKMMKKYTNNEIAGLKNVRVPKLLVDNVLIINTIIDKFISKKNNDVKIKKCNEFDVLAFDNILTNLKIKREKHKSQDLESIVKLNKYKIK